MHPHRHRMTCHDCGHTWTAATAASWHRTAKDSHNNVTSEAIQPIMPGGTHQDYIRWAYGDDAADSGKPLGVIVNDEGARALRREQARKTRGRARRLLGAFTAGLRDDAASRDAGYGRADVRVSAHDRRVNGRRVPVTSHTRRRRR